MSTAFQDYYEIYATPGQKVINLKYSEAADLADIERNGLRLFTYCTGLVEMMSSTFMTGMLWVGGSGYSKYFDEGPTHYQNVNNRLFYQQYTLKALEERVIKKIPL